MIFLFRHWNKFCKNLALKNIKSIPACCVTRDSEKYLVLKHDVETNVKKALKMASIENQYGHRGSYYVQAYLLCDEKNVKMLSQMQAMGHEISYHHDVMDSNKGDVQKAIEEFEKNKNLFEQNGFDVYTVCQHGNPIVERAGYTSNRDFFRNQTVNNKYSTISDIMVNFKQNFETDYAYFSDAGRKFKFIFDPINNDIVNSDDKNIAFKDLDMLLSAIIAKERVIISTHPHRWMDSAMKYVVKTVLFQIIKFIAKTVAKIPFLKKIMSRYYYLAKKI